MARAHRLCAHVLMATEARISDPLCFQLRVIRFELVHAVARRTRQILAIVYAATPVRLSPSIVTGQAEIRRFRRLHALDGDHGTLAFTRHHHLRVRGDVAVALTAVVRQLGVVRPLKRRHLIGVAGLTLR
jgi:hypothetical protein